MSRRVNRTLIWAPRVLSTVYISFLSLFSLDALDGSGFWQGARAMAVHLIPVSVLITVLALAWRREWVGAVSYTAAGLLYALWVVSGQNSLPPATRLTWILTITGPAFVIAGLYLANWLRHDDLWSVY